MMTNHFSVVKRIPTTITKENGMNVRKILDDDSPPDRENIKFKCVYISFDFEKLSCL